MTRSHHAQARFVPSSWEEEVVVNVDGTTQQVHGVDYPARGFTRADVTNTYSGDLEGTGRQVYLIAYAADADQSPGFALEHVEGTLDGHDGAFMLAYSGHHDTDGVHMDVTIVDGSGTGGLEGITGEGRVDIAGQSDDGYPITLDYDL
jgi:hypothetical protein